MIKAKKGLLIALFAAMMVFAFGATSAFATQTQTSEGVTYAWSDDFSTVKITGEDVAHSGWTYKAERFYDNEEGTIVAIVTDAVNDVDWELPIATAEFYDLSEASFADLKGTYDWDRYAAPEQLKLGVPSYVKNKDAAATPVVNEMLWEPFAQAEAKIEYVDSSTSTYYDYWDLGNCWEGVAIETPEFDPEVKTEQKFTVSVDAEFYATPNGWNKYFIKDTVPAKEVTVLAKTLTPAEDAEFYFDDADNVLSNHQDMDGGYVYTVYDGSAHTLAATPIDGWTVSYKVFNKKTGTWDAKESVSITDATDEAVQVQATYTKGTTEVTTASPLRLMVFGMDQPTFHFAQGNYADNSSDQAVEGTDYDAWSFIEMVPYKLEAVPNPLINYIDDPKAYVKAYNKASKAAAEANSEELLAAFKEVAEFKTTTYAVDKNKVDLKLVEKDLTSKEIEALAEKYETLLNNFDADFDDVDSEWMSTPITARVHLNYATVQDEVLFTEAPDMTYHVKKAKKLKKTKSFTVAAVAASGKTVSYKMDSSSKKITIDSATGKITVKKGIKKGTYKVKVIASTDAGQGYLPKQAVRYLQIKIKK